jgi:hypothetical protein
MLEKRIEGGAIATGQASGGRVQSQATGRYRATEPPAGGDREKAGRMPVRERADLDGIWP